MNEIPPVKLELGEYTLDLAARVLRRGDEPVPLSNLPFRVLVYLVENRDRVVGRDELFDRFWDGKDVYGDTMHKCIGAIRKALDDSASSPRFVATVHRQGYRYVGPFAEASLAEPPVVEVETTRAIGISFEREYDDSARLAVDRPRAPAPFSPARVGGVVTLVGVAAVMALAPLSRSHDAVRVPPASPAVRSIAVLPLENLTGDAGEQFFSDGVTESLINDLSRINNLKVISRRSAFAVDTAADPREIGRRLGVASVLEGSLRRSGDAIRVEVRLVSTDDGRVLWASDADGLLAGNVFDVQEALACRVAGELRVTLCGAGERVGKRYTENVGSYRAYLKGRHHWNRRTPDDLRRAIEHYEAAVALDPSYALAYAGLAETYAVMEANSVVAPGTAAPKAEAYARRALALDDGLAAAWAALGLVRNCAYEWAEGERLLKRALELSPGYAPARHWYAHLLLVKGRFEESEAEFMRARASDPLSSPVAAGTVELYYHWRRYERAVEEAKAAAPIHPGARSILWSMAMSYLAEGRKDEALEASSLSGFDAHRWLTVHLAGDAVAERRFVAEAASSQTGATAPYVIATMYARLGDVDEALRWLERAYDVRHADLAKIGVAPELDPVRADPRFADLLARVGLDDTASATPSGT